MKIVPGPSVSAQRREVVRWRADQRERFLAELKRLDAQRVRERAQAADLAGRLTDELFSR